MSVQQFRQLGYVQELNRQFLHPLGLAIEVVVAEDGSESFGEVWDYRDDPEGMVFGPGLIDPVKAERIEWEGKLKGFTRALRLGYIIQPLRKG